MRLIRDNVERVTDSPQEQQRLIKDGYKSVDEEKEPEAPPQAEKLAELTVKQLRQKAEERGIVGVEALSKAELLEIMEES